MRKTTELSWNELWPIVNVLNEVCYGLKINNTENEVGFNREAIIALLNKITAYEVEERKSDDKFIIDLDREETEIIKKCFDNVLKQIEEWEFSTRIGVSINEARKIKERLTQS